MTSKNPRPLTQPRPGEPNHGKFCAQPGSLPTTDLPMQPSLKEQMHGAEKDPVQVAPFDHKACILCDRVIVQKILGNKCKISGALCCNLKSCPIEDRKKREAVPVKQLTIESYGDGAISIAHYPFETCFNKQEVAELRAYLNKDVIKTLESWINGLDYPDCPPGDAYSRVIALLRSDTE